SASRAARGPRCAHQRPRRRNRPHAGAGRKSSAGRGHLLAHSGRRIAATAPAEADVRPVLDALTVPPVAKARLASRRFTMRVSKLLEYRRQQQEIDEVRIELRAASAKNDVQRLDGGTPIAIAAVMRHCVERVGDRDDPRRKRNRDASESAWISGSVPPLVMRQHGFRELFVKVRDRRQYLGAAHRMRGDFMALFRCQLALLVHDVEQRFVNLAYVVKQRTQFDRTPRLLVHTDHVGKDERVTRDAADVRAGLRIVGVDRLEQRLQRGSSEALSSTFGAVLAQQPSARANAGDKSQTSHAVMQRKNRSWTGGLMYRF